MEYYPWVVDDEDDSFAWIKDRPEEIIKKHYLLNDGVSVREWFPGEVTYKLAEEKGTKLTDAIPNILQTMFVSEKLKDILKKESDADIEFLPIKIMNHKNRLVKKDYYIANLIGTVECVNMDKSDYIMDRIIKDQVNYFMKLVMDESKTGDQKIFRLKEKTNLIIIRDDLADMILDADCTGMMFQEMEDYGSRYRD